MLYHYHRDISKQCHQEVAKRENVTSLLKENDTGQSNSPNDADQSDSPLQNFTG